jgi:hypothetical protein
MLVTLKTQGAAGGYGLWACKITGNPVGTDVVFAK